MRPNEGKGGMDPPVHPEGPPRPRLAVVTHAFYPSVGGAERYHLITADRLSRVAQVCVFTAVGNQRHSPALPGDRPPGFPVVYLPSRRVVGEHWIDGSALRSALERFQPDLLWTNQPSPSADTAARWALGKGVPWITTYHADPTSRNPAVWVYSAWEVRLLRRAHRILVTSEHYREKLVQRGVPAGRIEVDPPGPTLGGDGISSRVLPTSPRDAPGKSQPFLFVGALDGAHAYKRLDLLLGALDRLLREGKEIHLWVVGEGPRRPHWEAWTRSRGLSSHVEFLGRLPDRDLAERYARAWATVLPAISDREGFGLAALDSVQFRCPVVASDAVAAGREFARLGCGLTFPAKDPRGLPTALGRLWQDPSLRSRLAERCGEVSSQFSWERTIQPVLRELFPGKPDDP